MINVLFVIDCLGNGGKERQLVEIIRALPKDVFCIQVITFNKNQHYSKFVKNNVFSFVELKKRPTRIEPFFTIWKSFWNFKPKIVHTWDSLSSLYAYMPIKYFHSKFIDGSIRDTGVDKGWEYHLKKYFLKRADIIISNSIAGTKYYDVLGVVIYNAIDKKRFIKSNTKSEFNIIMVANFTNHKDHQTFVNAAIHLVSNNIVDNIYFLGEGPNKSKYIDFIKNNYNSIFMRFHFLGSIGNVEEYLAKCTIGVLCSTSKFGEGISNSILEYMAAGLIPIATSIGGTSEIINNKINGFLIEEKDSNRIIEIVEQLRDNIEIRKQISSNAIETITNKFSYSKNIENLIEIYKGLCIK